MAVAVRDVRSPLRWRYGNNELAAADEWRSAMLWEAMHRAALPEYVHIAEALSGLPAQLQCDVDMWIDDMLSAVCATASDMAEAMRTMNAVPEHQDEEELKLREIVSRSFVAGSTEHRTEMRNRLVNEVGIMLAQARLNELRDKVEPA